MITEQLEATINYMIATDNSCQQYIPRLEDYYFRDSNQKRIFTAIKKRYEDGKRIDLVLVASDLAEVGKKEMGINPAILSEWLEKQSMLAVPSMIGEYVSKLVDINYSLQVRGLINQDLDAKEMREELEKIHNKFAPVDDKVTIGAVELAGEAMEDILDKERSVIDLGFRVFDQGTELSAGSMCVVAARPSTGKTAFMIQSIINACKKGKTVGLLSLEMDEKDIAKRAYACLSGIEYKKILDGNLSRGEEDKLQKAAGSFGEMKLFVNSKPNMHIESLRTVAKSMVVSSGVEIIFIDYLGLIQGNRRKSLYENMTDISKEVKQMARELGIPIVVLAQLNRDIEKRGADAKPMLSDLRDSGAIEQDADIITMLHRDSDPYDEYIDKIVLMVRKNRNGPLFTTNMRFDKRIQRISESYI